MCQTILLKFFVFVVEKLLRNFMEFKGELIRTLLRVLTPEEIGDLTISSTGKKKVDLSLIIESSMSGLDYKKVMEKKQEESEESDDESLGEAKILAFDEKADEVVEPISFQAGQRVHALMEQYGKVFAEMDKKVMGPKRFPKRKSAANRQPTSALIIEQKKKLHASYSKIKSMEVLSLYNENKSVDIPHNKGKEEDFSFSSRLGVLINKKQA